MKIFVALAGFVFAILLISSCGGSRQLTYMQAGQLDTARLSQIKAPQPIIQNGDLLGIIVFSDNPRANALYNQPVANAQSGGSPTNFGISSGMPQSGNSGYLVDNSGNIQFQGLGTLHIAGLTKQKLAELLDSKFKDSLLQNPYYDIRFLNYKVTLIGDVNKPGVYSIPTERVTILEALGLAGDMTFYGKREDVFVIRETNGKREFGKIDLTNPEAISSPYYYLQQNDMVIVNADKKKAAANDQTTVRNITIATSIVSAVGIIVSIITR
jgi:polysaccharide export outer membrane protein